MTWNTGYIAFDVKSLFYLDVLRRLVQVVMELADDGVQVLVVLALHQALLLHAVELELEVRDGEVQAGVVLMIPLQFVVHLLNLLLHIRNLRAIHIRVRYRI